MTTNFHTDDTSDIFWPGYVDAVTNLAINLLFVVAVMSIVVFGSNLQIAELQKIKLLSSSTNIQGSTSPNLTVTQLEEKIKISEINLQKTQLKLVEAEKQLKQKTVSETQVLQTEIISVMTPNSNIETDTNEIRRMGDGVVVNFAIGAVTMSNNEVAELMARLNSIGHVKSSSWFITVTSPKGFSETLRLAYYRANAVRNALLENGVPGSAIDMKIIESTKPSASNAKVMVRLQP